MRIIGWAWTLTGVWVVVIAAIVFHTLDRFGGMDPNEWGDFLAGVAAPLALLWLVAGYFQHGREIELQQRELRQQVEETAQLAKHSERQAQASEKLVELTRVGLSREELREAREAEPDFIFSGSSSGGSGGVTRVDVRNLGAKVRDLEVYHDGPHQVSIGAPEVLVSDGVFSIRIAEQGPLEFPIRLSVAYTDHLGQRHSQRFEINERLRLVKIPKGGPD